MRITIDENDFLLSTGRAMGLPLSKASRLKFNQRYGSKKTLIEGRKAMAFLHGQKPPAADKQAEAEQALAVKMAELKDVLDETQGRLVIDINFK